jgi:hypothetical protein
MITSQKLQTHCQVCGGVTSDAGDIDSRVGHIEVEVSWGPNAFDGIIAEQSIGILGYAVYAANECGERQGLPLATVQSLGILMGTEQCCDTNKYKVTVRSQVSFGVTKQSFMVVPLTAIGPLDVGWVTSAIVDAPVNATATQVGASASGKAVLASPTRPELSSDSTDHSSESHANVEEAEASAEDADASPQLDATDGEDVPVWEEVPVWSIVVLALLIPCCFMCAYAVWKKQRPQKSGQISPTYMTKVKVAHISNESESKVYNLD